MDVLHGNALFRTELDAPPELVMSLLLQLEAVDVSGHTVPFPEERDNAASGAEVDAGGVALRRGKVREQQRVGAEPVVRGDEDRKTAAERLDALVFEQGTHGASFLS